MGYVDVAHRGELAEYGVISPVLPVGNRVESHEKTYHTAIFYPEEEGTHVAVVAVLVVQEEESRPVCNRGGVAQDMVEENYSLPVVVPYHIDLQVVILLYPSEI